MSSFSGTAGLANEAATGQAMHVWPCVKPHAKLHEDVGPTMGQKMGPRTGPLIPTDMEVSSFRKCTLLLRRRRRWLLLRPQLPWTKALQVYR